MVNNKKCFNIIWDLSIFMVLLICAFKLILWQNMKYKMHLRTKSSTISHQTYVNTLTTNLFIWLKMQYTHLTKALKEKSQESLQSNPLSIFFQIHIEPRMSK